MGNIKLNITPYSVESEAVITSLQSDGTSGLSSSEVEKRLEEYGANKIEAKKSKSLWLIFFSQFKSPIVWLLVFAAGLSFYFGEWLDGIAILAVIFINALIGFYMEFQAERSMNELKKLSAVPAKVLRNKQLEEINAEDIVPGDVVYIEAGDMIPADGRIFNATQLQVDESALTGESVPVEKQTGKLSADTTLAERNNMLYKGTYSTKGNGYVVVTDTGMDTELGKIASMVQSAEQAATPLEKKLEDFSKKLIWVTVALVVIIFIAGLLNGQKLLEMLETSIALAVAAIPEGLPIVATMALAQGMMKMARYNVIVKKLSAVETLGGTNVICTDKTGTLTQNKIEVNTIVTPADNSEALEIINRIAVLCNTSELQNNNGTVKEIGDPLEIGLLKFALKNNFNIQNCRNQFPKIKEEPFSSETKVMATLHQTGNDLSVYAKGASEEVLKRCNHILEKEGITELNAEKKELWAQKAEELANTGLKVIAGAYKPAASSDGDMVANLVFVGLFGMIDPPREEVFAAIEECKSAGINVIMITGDHPATAKNIALKLGIADNNVKAMAGKEMKDYEQLTEKEKLSWMDTKVFARVSPKQKLDLVAVLQEGKNIVGMTGDGVNDAPALKKADIGIAMGLRGTQVSQEVADMVLKDDSFSSIVVAIKQGRVIFDNIRKFVIFLLSCNLSELMVIATASVLHLHFQLFPLQILFINLITDVLPALALGVTEGSPDIMQRPPRNINEPIIDRKRWTAIFFYSIIIGAMSVGAVFFSHFTVHKTELWNPQLCNNILFFTLIFSQLLHVLNMGGNHSSFFKSEVFRNKYVWGAIALSVAILIGMYAIEPVRKVLSLYEMSANDWLISVSASIVSLIIIQIGKKLKIAQQ